MLNVFPVERITTRLNTAYVCFTRISNWCCSYLCISYLSERVCSCAQLVIEESIGGNWQRWYQYVLVVPDLWSVYTYLISLFVGRQEQRLGYKSKIAHVNSLPFHGDNGAIFRGQFSANSIMIEI